VVKGIVGDYCEMVAAAAFIAGGAQLAKAWGTSPDWDFLVKEDGEQWRSVQVKTVGRLNGHGDSPYVDLTRTAGAGCYQVGDVDMVVGVYPETGAMWKVMPEAFAGARLLRLDDEWLWVGNVDRRSLPMSNVLALKIERKSRAGCISAVREKLQEERRGLWLGDLSERPDSVSAGTWDVFVMWMGGHGYKSIADKHGLTAPGVRDRMVRLCRRLGIKGGPI